MKKAFTLAEVLITLGVVGIIAAMTLPSLITNYKVKVLKTQFKKMESTIRQALLSASDEIGFLSDYYGSGGADPNLVRPGCVALEARVPELNEIWLKQFKGATKVSYQELRKMTNNHCYSVFGTKTPLWTYSCYGDGDTYILADGSSVSPLFFSWEGRFTLPCTVSFIFDTNGPAKGPNRLGYDIFKYESLEYTNNSLCNPNVNHSSNAYGCYYYARRDKNPVYDSKSYWDILYKPSSYWKPNNSN